MASLSEDRQSIGELVVDLEGVPVGVVEVDALLADMVDRPRDLHAALPKGRMRLPERRLALDPKGDVTKTPHPGRLPLRDLRVCDLKEVDRVTLTLERHEDSAMLGVFLEHPEA